MTRAVWHCALAAALIVSTSAVAQAPRTATPSLFPGAQGQKQDLPVQIDAKSLEVQDKKKTATFTGNVKVVQGDTTMTCRTLEVFYGQELGIAAADAPVVKTNSTAGVVPNAQNIRLIEAHGDVSRGQQGPERDRRSSVSMTCRRRRSRSPAMWCSARAKTSFTANKLIVDTVTGNAHVEGATQTGVRAVIVPNKNQHGADSNVMTIGPGPTAPSR